MIRLYDNHISGNGYKPRLLLAHLGQSCERVEIDIMKGESRTPEFLAMNPNGRIPVLRLDDGTCLADRLGMRARKRARPRMRARRPGAARHPQDIRRPDSIEPHRARDSFRGLRSSWARRIRKFPRTRRSSTMPPRARRGAGVAERG